MPLCIEKIPLSLYIHLPWCVQKCPYCDFNSHTMHSPIPEELYVHALRQELELKLSWVQGRSLKSIFFGGGTPSLFSPQSINQILEIIAKKIHFTSCIEITLEANPGTVDQTYFQGFKAAGINRLSLGIQSLQNVKLKTLGRIHDSKTAIHAVNLAKQIGFSQINIDIMYGLPQQTVEEAKQDIDAALSLEPSHFSWYQLTIEPNTLFYKKRPTLPEDELIEEMQLIGQASLKQAGFQQYEVSAYAKTGQECVHNRNYWEFGDYLGLGAGAHSKITDVNRKMIFRSAQVRHPRDYLDIHKRQDFQINEISEKELIFEFMLNALRLTQGVSVELFEQRTGISISTESIQPLLMKAKKRGLLVHDNDLLSPTELGKKFLNDVIEMFLH